jgi:indole-3-glycerol phosphate synthase
VTILDTIVAHKKEEVAARKRAGLQPPDGPVAPRRPFREALLQAPDVAIIAEVKKASPSKGLLCPDFEPVSLARDYETGGATAISVLTDERFFQGSLEFLPRIRQEMGLPILRKDFLIDHFQVEETALWGADALLLIVAVMEDSQLAELLAHARETGLDALVEVHSEREMERAMKVEADLIGVNNRDLADFSVSLDTTFRIRKALPPEVPLVSESGISTSEDVRRLLEAEVDAALIGETLVRATDRVATLTSLIQAGRR